MGPLEAITTVFVFGLLLARIRTQSVCPNVTKYGAECPLDLDNECESDDSCSGDLKCCPSIYDDEACQLLCLSPQPQTSCPVSLDFAFILDGSGSISKKNWGKIKEFVKRVMDAFDVSPDGTHFALLEYSTDPKVYLRFNDFVDAQLNVVNVKRKVEEIIQSKGKTFIDKALELANQEIFTAEGGMRADVKQIALVLTDGTQTEEPSPVAAAENLIAAAQQLHDKGIDVIALGIGKNVNPFQILNIASDENNIYTAEKFEELLNLVAGELTRRECLACSEPVDVVFGIPTSQSIPAGQFESMKYFVNETIDSFDVGPLKVHVGFVTYSSSAQTTAAINQLDTKEDLESFTSRLSQRGKSANVVSALDEAYSSTFTIYGGVRQSKPKVFILIVPEGSVSGQQEVLQAATRLKSLGVRLLTVGVGQNVDQNLYALASTQPPSKFFYSVPDHKKLGEKSRVVADVLCKGKVGKCPLPSLPPEVCPRNPDDECDVDADCNSGGGSPLCCLNGCGGRQCLGQIRSCFVPMDVAIAVDNSDATTSSEFNNVKRFLKQFINQLASSEVRFSLLEYGNTANVITDFRSSRDQIYLENLIDNMAKRNDSERRVDAALNTTKEKIFSLAGGIRHGHPRYLVFVSSGGPTAEFIVREGAGKKLRDLGVTFVAIGTNTGVPGAFLQKLGGDSRFIYRAEEPSQLGGIVLEDLSRKLCAEKPGTCPVVDATPDPLACQVMQPDPEETIVCGLTANGGGPSENYDWDCPGEMKCCLDPQTGCFQVCLEPENVCSKQFDLTIVMENSARIDEDQFEQVKDFSKQFVNAFDVREEGTHVAIVSYGTAPVVHTRFDSYSGPVLSKEKITDDIDKIVFESGNAVTTNTALTEVFKTVYGDGNGARNGTNKTVVLITAGNLSDPMTAVDAAIDIRAMPADLFVVAIGEDPDVHALVQIVSPPAENNVFLATTSGDLRPSLRTITDTVCEGAEKMSTIIGPPGDPGVAGNPGPEGPAGPRGDPGDPGEPGEAGEPGPLGPPGPPGPPGSPGGGGGGTIGSLRPPGEKGPINNEKGPVVPPMILPIRQQARQGPPGRPGIPGPRGPRGPPGIPGYRGRIGARGPRGRVGLIGPVGRPGRRGTEGAPGKRGNPGILGEPGEKGQSGDSGEEGHSGLKGHKGRRGQTGPIGERGEEGETGMQGVNGAPGTNGKPGKKGPHGITGKQGSTGSPGSPGAKGVEGEEGDQGAAGKPGSPGTPGVVGQKGESGTSGLVGYTGYQGDSGNTGPMGPKGTAGSDGEIGEQGPIGGKGSIGDNGSPGEMGAQGLNGREGSTGTEGPRGYQGSTGNPGIPGKRGEVGVKGKPGNSGRPGSPGRRGPRGKRGAYGDTGAKGTMGIIGSRGPAGSEGPMGSPGERGVKGVPGIEGSRGYSGRQGERGDMGDYGPLGVQGEQGPPGLTGRTGRSGSPGLHGEEGDSGKPGEVGPLGASGSPGISGPVGTEGELGKPGDAGEQGEAGPEGPKGALGPSGTIGSPGVAGQQGSGGAVGEAGDTGLPGGEGLPGFPGSKGDDGSPGAKGSKGDDGMNGVPGSQGPMGKSGDKGSSGKNGVPGASGERGDQGKSGQIGVPGPMGQPGILGPVGRVGSMGAPGHSGDSGSKGEMGMRGPHGKRGKRGSNGQPGKDSFMGSRGAKGSRGEKGVTGEGGLPGMPGNNGNLGPRGDSGDQGGPGFEGTEGSAGPVGNQGRQGDPGIKGSLGEDGLPGPAGEQGIRGAPGYRGTNGPLGDRGPLGGNGAPGGMGSPGATGPSGELGAAGIPGLDGKPAQAGSLGNRGMPGSRGERGIPGRPGRDGVLGGTGDSGPQGQRGEGGPSGPPGRTGQMGLHGLIGARGIIGEVGSKGDTGDPGASGKDGATGKQGEAGRPGRRGSPGDRGKEGTLGSGGPIGNPGRDGFKGVPGEPGGQGTTGQPGLPGIAGSPGMRGSPGSSGMDGGRGESGGLGSKGLAGEAGDAGEPGENGETGIVGNKGDRGDPGQRGPSGKPGLKGPEGSVGQKGNRGRTGPRGEDGALGRAGIQGSQGSQGIDGLSGFPGERGDAGHRGPEGDRGMPGPSGPPGPPADIRSLSGYVQRLNNRGTGSYSIENEKAKLYRGSKDQSGEALIDPVKLTLALMHYELEMYKQPNGTKEFPARTCRDLVACYPGLTSGDFWIDPNEGVPDDAVKVYCDFSFNATCLHSNNEKKPFTIRKRKWFLGPDEYKWLGADLGAFNKIKYVKYSSQISFLRLLSDRARQSITYHCKNSVAWYDQQLNDVTKSLKIMTDNGVIIHSSSSNKFKPSVLADNCQVKNGTWLYTIIQVDTPKPNRLPVRDVAAYDIGDENEEFGLEIGPVCFY